MLLGLLSPGSAAGRRCHGRSLCSRRRTPKRPDEPSQEFPGPVSNKSTKKAVERHLTRTFKAMQLFVQTELEASHATLQAQTLGLDAIVRSVSRLDLDEPNSQATSRPTGLSGKRDAGGYGDAPPPLPHFAPPSLGGGHWRAQDWTWPVSYGHGSHSPARDHNPPVSTVKEK